MILMLRGTLGTVIYKAQQSYRKQNWVSIFLIKTEQVKGPNQIAGR